MMNNTYNYVQVDPSKLNQNYNGNSDQIIADDFNLAENEYTLIEVVHTLDLLGFARSYLNNSTVSANTINSSKVHTDISQDGTDPNLNGSMDVNNRPDPSDDADPTIFSFALLPVELSLFNVTAKDCTALVKWSTESESNNDKFLIERSENGVDFEVIGEVQGAGQSDRQINYEFLDEQIAARTYYYRLTQVDFDGSSEQFSIQQVHFADCEFTSELKIYPNPVHQESVIDIPEQFISGDTAELFIYSTSGQMVYNNTVATNANKANANAFMQLAKGAYIVFVIDEQGNRSNVVKVIK